MASVSSTSLPIVKCLPSIETRLRTASERRTEREGERRRPVVSKWEAKHVNTSHD